jgi:hypothetical protein
MALARDCHALSWPDCRAIHAALEQPMALYLILALQAAAAPAPALAEVDFDLARYRQVELGLGACRRDPSEIVVCARREGGAYPLAEMARIFEPGRIVAEARIAGNLTGDLHLEQVQPRPADRGGVANRIMFGLRLPF